MLVTTFVNALEISVVIIANLMQLKGAIQKNWDLTELTNAQALSIKWNVLFHVLKDSFSRDPRITCSAANIPMDFSHLHMACRSVIIVVTQFKLPTENKTTILIICSNLFIYFLKVPFLLLHRFFPTFSLPEQPCSERKLCGSKRIIVQLKREKKKILNRCRLLMR